MMTETTTRRPSDAPLPRRRGTKNGDATVPRYRGTPLHAMRIPQDVWERALERAEYEGSNVTAEVVAFLNEYGSAPKRSWRKRRGTPAERETG